MRTVFGNARTNDRFFFTEFFTEYSQFYQAKLENKPLFVTT